MQKLIKLRFPALLCAVLFMLSSCALIFSGLNQKVDINSVPEKAKITVDGEYKGETPLTLKLRRGKNHTVRIELEGFEPYEIVTRKGLNAFTLGNIIIGGAIGMLIDLGTGAFYTVGPTPIFAELNAQQEDTLKIGVTRNIPPEMRQSLNKIGELTPSEN